ncbi:hypothetical protein V8C86DRAFT_2508725, partial [Haematococcus lacustris]
MLASDPDTTEAELRLELAHADTKLQALKANAVHARTDEQQQDQDRHRHAAMFTRVSVEELQGSYSGQSSWPRADAWSHAHSTDQGPARVTDSLQTGLLSSTQDVQMPRPVSPARMQSLSLVKAVVSSSGQGIQDALGLQKAIRGSLPLGAWRTRSHKKHMESFVVLQLRRRESSNIVVQVVFEKPCLPRAVRFSHAASITGTFVQVGPDHVLTANSKHIFRLGKATVLQRFFRVSFLGHAAEPGGGVHAVKQLVVMCEDDGHASRSSSAYSTLASSFPQGEEDASNRQQGSTKAWEAAQRAGDSRRISIDDNGLQCTASHSRHACGEGFDGSQCTTASAARVSLALSQPPGMTGRSAQPDAQPSTAFLLPGVQSSAGIGRYKFNRRSNASLRRSRLVIKTPIPEGIEAGISSPEDVSGQTSDSSSNGHQASQLSDH